MTADYSAHPALASAQLQRAESASSNSQSHHRRHNSANTNKSASGSSGNSSPTKSNAKLATKKSATNTDAAVILPTLPDRTAAVIVDDDDDCISVSTAQIDCCFDDNDDNAVNMVNTKVNSSNDETDHVQHRFSRTTSNNQPQEQHSTCSSCTVSCSTCCSHTPHHHLHQHQHQHQHFNCTAAAATSTTMCNAAAPLSSTSCGIVGGSCGASSGLSSAGSSPSASTTSSPLSTPTRHVNPSTSHHCCQKAAAAAAGAALATTSSTTTSSSHPHHHQHHHTQQHPHNHNHHHHHSHHHNVAGCKKLQKFDPRLGPSPYRQLLPIALCILSFATVFSILIVYMDTTEIRHQQFRLNMSRDYELNGVAQDDPTLIAFLREIHMKKYPIHYLFKNRDASEQQQQHLNFSEHHELTPEMAHYVADLVGGKLNGAVIQSLPGAMGQMMTAPWLAGTLNWAGVIVEPEPRRYFALRKQNALYNKMQVVHACVSPNEHPKEVTIHNEEADVRINSLLDEETSWFNSRVKCFPLYTIMLACNRVEYDLLSLGVHGHELEILQTLPFDKIKIEVISIHLPEDHENVRIYMQTVTKFLKGKSFKLQRNFGRNYFYKKIDSMNRTRKKDILLMKQP